MIKAVIFDCFGVLAVDNWHNFMNGITSEGDRINAHDLSRACDAGYITEKDLMQQLAAISGSTVSELDHLLKKVNSKNTYLLEFIAELKKGGYKLGIVSNIGSNWIRDELLTSEEQELFDDMVLSFQARLTKPDPRIFNLACERLAVKPAEALFIDDAEPYCKAAQNEGLFAVQYKSFRQTKADILELLHHE